MGNDNLSTNTAERTVVYMGNDAFTKCDCGKDLGLNRWPGAPYKGNCLCGKKFVLNNNKLYQIEHNEQR